MSGRSFAVWTRVLELTSAWHAAEVRVWNVLGQPDRPGLKAPCHCHSQEGTEPDAPQPSGCTSAFARELGEVAEFRAAAALGQRHSFAGSPQHEKAIFLVQTRPVREKSLEAHRRFPRAAGTPLPHREER